MTDSISARGHPNQLDGDGPHEVQGVELHVVRHVEGRVIEGIVGLVEQDRRDPHVEEGGVVTHAP